MSSIEIGEAHLYLLSHCKLVVMSGQGREVQFQIPASVEILDLVGWTVHSI